MKKTNLVILFAALLLFATLSVRPVPNPNEEDCLTAKGTVVEITEGGIKDIVFKLKGDDKIYYINRGLEMGFTLEKLRAELVNLQVTIKHPDGPWTIFDPFDTQEHIYEMEQEGKLIYSEMP